ncbi:MAG: Ig-like domain-containing protein [Kofleriaceae bacterium]
MSLITMASIATILSVAGTFSACQVGGISRIELHRRVARPLLLCLVMHELNLMRSQWTGPGAPKVERTSPRIRRRSMPLLVLVAACAVGCGSSATPPGSDEFTVFPSTTLYSGIDPAGGGASYKVTIAASHATGVTWASLDPTVATVSGTDALGTVVALKAGSTTITALASGATEMIPLTVAAYSASDLAAGATAYTTTYSCAKSGCHDASGPDVSPSGIAKHTDAQLVAVITAGENPEGGAVSIGAANHSFAIPANSAASRGICAYLRSLPPGTPVPDE